MHERPMSGFEKLREIWSRRCWLTVLVAASVFAAAAGGALGLPNLYRASATVLVERGQNEPDTPASLEGRLHVIGQEILSRTRLTELIARHHLYPELQQSETEEGILDRMRSDIQVDMKQAQEPGGRGLTTAFAVSYRGREPAVVADVTNALASFYVEEDNRIRAGVANTAKTELSEMKARVEEQERRLGGFRSEHGGGLPQQMDVTLGTLDRLQSQLRATSENRMRAAERRDSLLKQIAEADAGGASGDPDAAEARLAKLNRDLAELRRRFTDKYPDVQKLKDEIAVAERQVAEGKAHPKPEADTPGRRALAPLKQGLRDVEEDIRNLTAEEATLRREGEAYRRRASAAPQAGQALQELARDYETTKTLYAATLKKYEDARLAVGSKDGQGQRFRILEPAVAPIEPAAPNRLRLLVAGLILACAAGLGAAALAEQTDGSFHTVDDVRGFTRVPVLVSIPAICSSGDQRRRSVRLFWGTAATMLILIFVGQASYHVASGNDALVSMLARGQRS